MEWAQKGKGQKGSGGAERSARINGVTEIEGEGVNVRLDEH